jgi:hypothetical protein
MRIFFTSTSHWNRAHKKLPCIRYTFRCFTIQRTPCFFFSKRKKKSQFKIFSNSLFDSNERHFLLFYFRFNPRKNKIYRKTIPFGGCLCLSTFYNLSIGNIWGVNSESHFYQSSFKRECQEPVDWRCRREGWGLFFSL